MNRWFKWEPGRDTLVAVATDIAMWAIYFANSHLPSGNGIARLIIFVILGTLFLDVLFPAWYVLRVRGEPLSELGITTDRWWIALITSAALVLLLIPGFKQTVASHPDVQVVPHLIYNGIILWEPFFVYGWLQLRFERAFGIVPAIVLASAGIAAYHIGTFPLSGVIAMAVFGTIDSIAFRFSRNLLSMFPFTWAIASGIGTLQGGLMFTWDIVALYAVILVIQVAAIAIMARGAPPVKTA